VPAFRGCPGKRDHKQVFQASEASLNKTTETFAFLNKAFTLSGCTRNTKSHDLTAASHASICDFTHKTRYNKLECGPMPNVMAALPNVGGALCSTLQSFLADAHYLSAMQ